MPQPHNSPNFFAGPYINRCSETREDAAALQAIRADPATRYVLSVGGQQLLHATEGTESTRIAFLSGADPIARNAGEADLVLRMCQALSSLKWPPMGF